ncbi:allophanate hydrolase [Actinomadura sp. WMMB 499]|uniref:allophanate hydrolase n=1 Tax=Actinomadura sp. WMMB 499 TaxID=1219491 RepID=UPI001245438E|nr:allophanate hydrolase [Actinomadura sp. WMMB 499]QFG22586.1 allophanate hydrolase [Actinomadura sp. WMMB 499]
MSERTGPGTGPGTALVAPSGSGAVPSDLRIPAIRAAYRSGRLTPAGLAAGLLARIEERGDDAVWITLSGNLLDDAAALDPADMDDRPLWGVPFAVKDNIDVAGLPTTAGCPDYAYKPDETAFAVARLLDAGALLVGKTNLDQFATGLSGARSPYGTVRAHHDPRLISGGSSSGSAVAVAAGLVSFALGTDTAGSGRVPAALNGVTGLKPSAGLVSNHGVVPACRSLDCVSVMALDTADAAAVTRLLAAYDPADPWSRRYPPPARAVAPRDLRGLRFGVPDAVARWGTRGERDAWEELCAILTGNGADVVPLDYAPLFEAGDHLYGGPWLAERAQAIEEFRRSDPGSIHPVVRELLGGADGLTATDAFAAQHRMRQLRRRTAELFDGVDALLAPTVTETFTVAEMLADPIGNNNRLGRFSTYTNLLRLCAVAVPAGRTAAGLPFGVTVQTPAGTDDAAVAIAAAIETATADAQWLDLAVVGAHLRGMPLHHDLAGRGAVLRRTTTTSGDYRLYALDGGPPRRPGLVRTTTGGEPIEVEVYRLPRPQIGGFLATVAAPLSIGVVELADGSTVHGFVCETAGLEGAVDITHLGGWREYVGRASPAG